MPFTGLVIFQVICHIIIIKNIEEIFHYKSSQWKEGGLRKECQEIERGERDMKEVMRGKKRGGKLVCISVSVCVSCLKKRERERDA